MPTKKEQKIAKKNVYLFFGNDQFSLKQKLDFWKKEFSKKYSNQAITEIYPESGEELSSVLLKLSQSVSSSLFATKRLVIAKDIFPSKATQEDYALSLSSILENISPDVVLVFWQTKKPDGRLSINKQLIALCNPEKFTLPHGKFLDNWIITHTQTLGGEISKPAASLLAQYCGRDLYQETRKGKETEYQEAYDLYRIHTEIEKLVAYNPNITENSVIHLILPKLPDSVFDFTDYILAGNKKGAFEILNNLLQNPGNDDKNSTISLIALLTEQIRAILLVKLCTEKKLSQIEIAQKLGWSSGRVFMVSKHIQKFTIEKIKKIIFGLTEIDHRIKTSEVNAPLLLMQLFNKV
jgi:DNA polymerase-3 subunit delta